MDKMLWIKCKYYRVNNIKTMRTSNQIKTHKIKIKIYLQATKYQFIALYNNKIIIFIIRNVIILYIQEEHRIIGKKMKNNNQIL